MKIPTNITTVSKAAKAMGISARRLRKLCHDGRVAGAILIAGSWIIPLPTTVTMPPQRKAAHALN